MQLAYIYIYNIYINFIKFVILQFIFRFQIFDSDALAKYI